MYHHSALDTFNLVGTRRLELPSPQYRVGWVHCKQLILSDNHQTGAGKFGTRRAL